MDNAACLEQRSCRPVFNALLTLPCKHRFIFKETNIHSMLSMCVFVRLYVYLHCNVFQNAEVFMSHSVAMHAFDAIISVCIMID